MKRENYKRISRVSWGAIFAGTLTAIAVSILLNLLGFGLGFAAFNPLTESNPFSGLGTGTIIWWTVTNLIALFLGGLVAGRMAGFLRKKDGGLHGFLSWCVFSAVSLFLITSTVGFVISGVSGAISSVFGGNENPQTVVRVINGQQQGQNQQNWSYNNIKSEVFTYINQAEKYNLLPDDTSEEVRQTLQNGQAQARQMWQQLNLDENIDEFFNKLSFNIDKNGDLHISAGGDFIDKPNMKKYLTENTDLSTQEINGLINKWDKNIELAVNKVESIYSDAKQKVEKYSGQLSDTIAKISLISFFMFLLGAIAAFFGGSMGAKSNPEMVEEEYDERR